MYKCYNNIQKVKLDANHLLKAKCFAVEVSPSTNYGDANQNSRIKIQEDHRISKLGEEAAAFVLRQFVSVSDPDYSIYKGKQKSWKEDLQVNGVGVAVKSQNSIAAKKYGLSWTFQYGPKRKDSIFNNPEAWIIFVEVDESNETCICRVFPPFQLKELIFEEPKLAYLRGHKKVVYAESLKLD